MKRMKKLVCLLVVLIMTMSIVVLPASASENMTIEEKIRTEFPTFPVLRLNSTHTEYVKLLQRFLYVCPATYEIIYNTDTTYHGIDGGFGDRTYNAVRIFQYAMFGESGTDGIVGEDTWAVIFMWLKHNLPNNVFVYDDEISRNTCVFEFSFDEDTSVYSLFTYRANDTTFPYPFHRFTFAG